MKLGLNFGLTQKNTQSGPGNILFSGDAQSGTDTLLVSGDAQSGTDKILTN